MDRPKALNFCWRSHTRSSNATPMYEITIFYTYSDPLYSKALPPCINSILPWYSDPWAMFYVLTPMPYGLWALWPLCLCSYAEVMQLCLLWLMRLCRYKAWPHESMSMSLWLNLSNIKWFKINRYFSFQNIIIFSASILKVSFLLIQNFKISK